MALSPDLGAAGNVLVFIVCTYNWFNGIIVPYSQIQIFWRYWVSLLSSASAVGFQIFHIVSNCEIVILPLSIHLSARGHGHGRHLLGQGFVL